MQMIETLFTSGAVFDLVLVVLALEAAALIALGSKRTGLSARDILAMAAPGAALVAAARAYTLDASWAVLGACLSFAFAAHLWDLSRRMAQAAELRRADQGEAGGK